MGCFNFLPLEIALDILTRLPAESVLECKSVCKTWTSLVRDPSFYKKHLNHHRNHSSSDSGTLGFLALTGDEKFSYFEYNDQAASPVERITKINFTPPFKGFGFVGSCTGLICLARCQSVCICNPLTREIVMLPEINKDACGFYRTVGFGYVSSTNEYKIVRMCRSQTGSREIHVYTLGSGKGWRNLTLDFEIREKGIFANGDLYWIDVELARIITFDLSKEKFYEHLLPPDIHHNWYPPRIGVLDGFLSFGINLDVNLDVGGDGLNDVWQLKTKNENHEMKEQEEHQSLGWKKKFRIDKISKFVDIMKSDTVLTHDYYHLNLYDTKTSTSKRLVKLKDFIHQVYPHKNTLVSLKELMEEDTKGMVPVDI